MIIVILLSFWFVPKIANFIIEKINYCEWESTRYDWECYKKIIECSIEFWSWEKEYIEKWLYSECIVTSCMEWYIIQENSCTIEIPKNPREYIDYIMEKWQLGKDYEVIIPEKPWPQITSQYANINSQSIIDYIVKHQTKHTRTIPAWITNWYIMFVTTKEINKDRKLFLWLRDANRWTINKTESLDRYWPNEYVYNMRSIPQLSDSWLQPFTTNLFRELQNRKLSVIWVVWESNNRVEKIVIVRK